MKHEHFYPGVGAYAPRLQKATKHEPYPFVKRNSCPCGTVKYEYFEKEDSPNVCFTRIIESEEPSVVIAKLKRREIMQRLQGFLRLRWLYKLLSKFNEGY